jgi:hypothetical protein
MQMRTSSFTMAGGGVHGKGAGIAHDIMTRVGSTIKAYHLFIEGYHQAGGMITGTIDGENTNGNTSEYPTNSFNGTGTPGKRANIGRSRIPGVYRV